jgi:hypothetical protein
MSKCGPLSKYRKLLRCIVPAHVELNYSPLPHEKFVCAPSLHSYEAAICLASSKNLTHNGWDEPIQIMMHIYIYIYIWKCHSKKTCIIIINKEKCLFFKNEGQEGKTSPGVSTAKEKGEGG